MRSQTPSHPPKARQARQKGSIRARQPAAEQRRPHRHDAPADAAAVATPQQQHGHHQAAAADAQPGEQWIGGSNLQETGPRRRNGGRKPRIDRCGRCLLGRVECNVIAQRTVLRGHRTVLVSYGDGCRGRRCRGQQYGRQHRSRARRRAGRRPTKPATPNLVHHSHRHASPRDHAAVRLANWEPNRLQRLSKDSPKRGPESCGFATILSRIRNIDLDSARMAPPAADAAVLGDLGGACSLCVLANSGPTRIMSA